MSRVSGLGCGPLAVCNYVIIMHECDPSQLHTKTEKGQGHSSVLCLQAGDVVRGCNMCLACKGPRLDSSPSAPSNHSYNGKFGMVW